MDSPYSGPVLEPSKCSKLSIKEKREFVYELSKCPETAAEKLQTWSRRDLLEILCAEMGKERKYTGVTKQKLIGHLFQVLSDKKSGKVTEDIEPIVQTMQLPPKRQRKMDHPSRLPADSKNIINLVDNGVALLKKIRYCDNVVCKATLSIESVFCKRCTCGICYQYDDNKDPSLWLLCSSDDPYQGESCGVSYHIECILKHERAGIMKNGQCDPLDGSYYCIYCRKENDLLACWRKQLMYVKDARRVDTLCQRVSISHRILKSTEKYIKLHEILDVAMKKLESELGPINDLSNVGRGIVNRLSVGAEVQKLCAQAVELRDSMFLTGSLYQKTPGLPSNFITFEDTSSNSLTLVIGPEDNTLLPQDFVGCKLWHRRADTKTYPTEPTSRIYKPNRRFTVTNLSPSTEYIFKVIAISNTTELGNWEVRAETEAKVEGNESNDTPDSLCDFLEKSIAKDTDKEDTPLNSGSGLDEDSNPTTHEVQNQASDVPKSDNESDTKTRNEIVVATLPVTPSRVEADKPNPSINSLESDQPNVSKDPGSSSKKRSVENFEKNIVNKDGSSSSVEGEYEYCVKVIRWLECEGHIDTSFRVKFLTWFSLRATTQERRVVSVYVDTLIDDPSSLAGQLVDTFSEAISSKKPPSVLTGFCTRLWH